MKKKLLVLSIISVVLGALGFVCAYIAFKPNLLTGLLGCFTSMFAFQTMFAAKDYVWLVTAILSLTGLVLIVVFWLLHLIRLSITKAKSWIAVDILGLIGGLVGVVVFSGLLNKYAFVDLAQVAHPGLSSHSFIEAIFQFHSDWGALLSEGSNFPLIEDGNYIALALGFLAVVAVIVAWSLALRALVLSRKIMEGKVKENGTDEEAEGAVSDTSKEGEGAPSSQDELRGVQNAELIEEEEEEQGKKVGPYVVQYFNYGPAPMPAPAPEAKPEVKPEVKPETEEAQEEEEMLTSDDLRKIIREEVHPDLNAPKNPSLSAEEIREIVKEEIAKALQSQTSLAQPQENHLTTEQVRTILSQELDKRHPLVEAVEKEAPKPEVKLEPKPEVKPALAPAPAVVQVVPSPAPAEEKKKIIRIPFPERLGQADKDVKANYNEIKAEALSFGLKSRLSNSGDTFRLHTKTYLKITVAGKGLKIYYALDPKAFEDSPIPLKDVSHKNIYKEIPGCFKVKSTLSVKRAKQLIAEACEKDNLEQGKPEIKNYAAEMKDYKPQNGDDDDDGDDDDEK